jgi:predicted pyridoxine 5'-phosphate oxidase superfamily flavin-nucleotide-binding protein
MSEFYTDAQRVLQETFGTRALADRLEAGIVTAALQADQLAFVHGRDFCFLSTVDGEGFPSVSYKGGAPGFVRCPDAGTLVFPSYDGNGMFVSAGNIADSGRVGMLFMDFEIPRRVRVRGSARLLDTGPMFDSYPGADLVVQVAIERVWQNCPRYVHRMERAGAAVHVPDETGEAPFAAWKRIDAVQDVLPAEDRERARARGLLTAEDYEALVEAGET